jgi:hypothetical protein
VNLTHKMKVYAWNRSHRGFSKHGPAIKHLEALREDARDEIKRRIEQRDKYSIQLTIALAAIVAVSFSYPYLGKVLIVAPLVTIYFTVLILYSYRIHTVLASYLRTKIEPELARLCGTPPELEWESFYIVHQVPGIRRTFFILMLWIVCATSLLYLWMTEGGEAEFRIVLWVATIIYALEVIWITFIFWRGQDSLS